MRRSAAREPAYAAPARQPGGRSAAVVCASAGPAAATRTPLQRAMRRRMRRQPAAATRIGSRRPPPPAPPPRFPPQRCSHAATRHAIAVSRRPAVKLPYAHRRTSIVAPAATFSHFRRCRNSSHNRFISIIRRRRFASARTNALRRPTPLCRSRPPLCRILPACAHSRATLTPIALPRHYCRRCRLPF